MKRTLLLFLLLSGCAVIQAQEQEKTKAFDGRIARHPVVFGIRGGINFDSFGPDAANVWDTPMKEKTHVGWNVGLTIDVPILESFYFQTGLFYKTKGFKLSGGDSTAEQTVKTKARFLQFPMLFSYRYNVKQGLQFEFNAGPYVACGVGGHVTDYVYKSEGMPGGFNPEYVGKKDPEITQRDVFGDDLDDSFGVKKTDVGLCFGVGMTVNRFYVGFQYDLGLTNLRNDVCWADKTRFRTGSATILMGFQLFRY